MSNKLLEPEYLELDDILKNHIYEIPVYQRPYSWGKEQLDTLLEDIWNAYEQHREYYVGNIIAYERGKIRGNIMKYHIIDGQQRITTFSLILLAIYSESYKFCRNLYDSIIDEINQCLWNRISRKSEKENRTVNLNSIEKDCFIKIMNNAFDNPQKIDEYINNYNCKNDFEKRVIDNYNNIIKFITEKKINKDVEGILDFGDFLLKSIKFIWIDAHCEEKEVFSMFESLNSKGKKLEEIDLIKTYIFSQIPNENYEEYIEKWGKLIQETNDELMDYITVFIRANIKYFTNSIKLENFRKMVKNDLEMQYEQKSESEKIMQFLDNLCENLVYYNYVKNSESACDFIKDNRFRFYHRLFLKMNYEHPKALLFKLLVEYAKGQIEKRDLVEIFIEAIKFMIKFMTIAGKQSKEAVKPYRRILENSYESKMERKAIIAEFSSKLISSGITHQGLKHNMNLTDFYSSSNPKNRALGIALLSLVEASEKKDDRYYISYDQAFGLCEQFDKIYSFDHLLVRDPKHDDEKYKYYKLSEPNKDSLVLKEGHDFPKTIVYNGMDYDYFVSTILNKLGNLRIYYRDKNSRRQNNGVTLKKSKPFYCYQDIVKREKEILDFIFEVVMPTRKVSISELEESNKKKKKVQNKYISMQELIDMGIINIDEEVELRANENVYSCKIVNADNVEYKGEIIKINRWGETMTGWTSINIYRYLYKKGEDESIHAIREKLAK